MIVQRTLDAKDKFSPIFLSPVETFWTLFFTLFNKIITFEMHDFIP